MPRSLIVCALVVAVLTAGCVSNPHSHGGKFIAEHRPGETPETAETPYKAVYALYHWQEPPQDAPPHTWLPDQQVAELFVRGLAREDKVGFEKGTNGELIAVAGNEKIPLEDGRYCWHITADSEYRGTQRLWHETGETARTVAAVPVAIVMLPITAAMFLCALPVFAGFWAVM